MLVSDPTTKKAASAKAGTWRQEIFDICPSFSDEGAAEDLCQTLCQDRDAFYCEGDASFPEQVRKSHLIADPRTYAVAAF